MTTQIDNGYLSTPYLTGPYMAGVAEAADGFQFDVIVNQQVAIGMQFLVEIVNNEDALGHQYDAVIAGVTEQFGLQFDSVPEAVASAGHQFNAVVDSGIRNLAQQFIATVQETGNVNMQVLVKIRNFLNPQGVQFESTVDAPNGQGMEFTVADTTHVLCPAYLLRPYLTEPYASGCYLAITAAQFNSIIAAQQATGFQFDAIVNQEDGQGVQFDSVINDSLAVGHQFDAISTSPFGFQFRVALYNTKLLRVLCDFPSRGLTGTNWTASTTATSATNDFDVNNLNNDQVENVWRSDAQVAGVQLTVDTERPQGVFNDTMAMLGTNLTRNASVQMIGATDAAFNNIVVDEFLTITPPNVFYIAPTLPLQAARYWRFEINDPGNQDGFVQIGSIVFGSAIIFSTCNIALPIRFRPQHFKDQLLTEGSETFSNDRNIKNKVSLSLRNLDFVGGDYRNWTEIREDVRTNRKCLWIPTPETPDRFAVFGKIVELPEEEHNDLGSNDADYVSFDVEVDESR